MKFIGFKIKFQRIFFIYKFNFKTIFFLALVLRATGIYLFRNITNFDLKSYLYIGELTLNETNIYPDIASLHHPYFPAFLYLEAGVRLLGNLFELNSTKIILIMKSVINLFDLGNLYLVYLLSNKNIKSTLYYAINPISILIFTLHGQFDSLPIFFLLCSLRLIKVNKTVLSMLFYSLAVMIKTWPLLFVINFYFLLKRKSYILLILLFPTLSVMIYGLLFPSSIFDIGKTIVNYQGLWGIWGLWELIGPLKLRWQKLGTLIFLLSFFIYSYSLKYKDIFKKIFLLLFYFFVFTTNFSVQYFSWLIPFLAVFKPRFYILTTLIIGFYLTVNYLSWITYVLPYILQIVKFSTWLILASIFLWHIVKNYLYRRT